MAAPSGGRGHPRSLVGVVTEPRFWDRAADQTRHQPGIGRPGLEEDARWYPASGEAKGQSHHDDIVQGPDDGKELWYEVDR